MRPVIDGPVIVRGSMEFLPEGSGASDSGCHFQISANEIRCVGTGCPGGESCQIRVLADRITCGCLPDH
ncbi:MAG: hypothetical protein HY722_09130 [Planctomycetes bacterium]|nr:hypothetical protein [Planctomycetota bacterium]